MNLTLFSPSTSKGRALSPWALLLCAALCASPASTSASGLGLHLRHSKDASSRLQWRSATPAELEAVLPARAQVVKEHIETEMRSATGVIDAHGRVVAAVVLITAGYAASGKYYYYLLAQAPIHLGNSINLPPGSYAVGWTRTDNGLSVQLYDADTGVARGTVVAKPITPRAPIVSVKIWPPSQRSVIQIGRFAVPYTLGN